MNYIVKKNNNLTMIRGDSFEHHFCLETGRFPRKKKLVIGDDDLIYFGVMYPNDHFEGCIFKKELTKEDFDSDGNLVVTINPEDTHWLRPGTYYYEIKLLYSSSENTYLKTLVQKTKFILID